MVTKTTLYRSLFFTACCWVVCLVPCTGQAQVFHPETTRLENGMTIVVLPNHRAPVVTHMLWFKAGAANDPWGVSGVAHFLEHLMFKGTPQYPEGMYSRIIAQQGGRENAFTAQDYTAYYATIGKEHIEQVMKLESDRMQHWSVTEDQVVRERAVVLKERQQVTENNPVASFFEDVQAVMYPNHPYQRPVIGWAEEIAALTQKDAEDFVRHYYAPNNAVLVLSGDVTLDEILPMVRRYYADIPARVVPEQVRTDVPKLASTIRIEKTSSLVDEVIWSRHRLLAPARPETMIQSDAQTVLAKILGDSRIGRLYKRLVIDDALASNASVSFDPVQKGPARFAVVVTPLPNVDLDVIAARVDDEITRLLDKGITQDELKQATQALDIEMVYARDSVQGPAQIVGAALTSGLDLETIEGWPKRLRALTKKDVDHAIQQVFNLSEQAQWVTAILRPEVSEVKP